VNAFTSAKQVEAEAYRRLKPLLAKWTDNGQFVLNDKGPMAALLQEMVGDITLNISGTGDVASVELKAEESSSANIFAEEWSNYPGSEDSVPNPGWARKTNATFLWFYFLDADDLLIFRRLQFQQALYGKRVLSAAGYADEIKGGMVYEPSLGIKLKIQRKREQKNTTAGFCVPISLLTARIPFRRYVVSDFLASA
jgi:hypothetical protein